jgi:hypothetical protein
MPALAPSRQWDFGCATMTSVKRSTAIGRLGDVCDGLDRARQWSDVTVSAAYVYGPLLDGDDAFESISIALVVDEPAVRVPWRSRPVHLEALAKLVRLDKLPVSWRWRPAEWPIWNHAIPRAARCWTAADGRDQTVLDALQARSTTGLELSQPPNDNAVRRQVEIELAMARADLADVTAKFGDREWRRDHTGHGAYPEDTLWTAAAAFVELDDWLAT